ILENDLRGTVRDPCNVARFDKEQASCAWDAHRKTFALGVDGWWPDEGDPLNSEARLARNRMYWEGPQLDRPDERPYALHRNGCSCKLRRPWGWNTGEIGPTEISGYSGSALPDPSELHNAQVEPICRKYLELRYRLLPYLYSAVREGTLTGMPVMRSLWLHYQDDPEAIGRGNEYLWGRDILVAPVVEKDATSRRLYLPRGRWFDFWTSERFEGGREMERTVDLETLPLFIREGAILPFGPVKQYVDEKAEASQGPRC